MSKNKYTIVLSEAQMKDLMLILEAMSVDDIYQKYYSDIPEDIYQAVVTQADPTYNPQKPDRLEVLCLKCCEIRKQTSKEMIEKADFIFLCGGHLPTQNKFFNDIGLKELLKNTNALIVGGSAGSMNCADVVYCPPELEEEVLDDNFNRYLKGLGLTNINIMPHFEEYKKMVICGKRYIDDIVVPDSHKIDIIALNNGSYIVIKDNQTTIYGESYLIRKGKITQINENQNTKHV